MGEVTMGGGQISEEALRERQSMVTPEEPAQILYTSGTTGFPKGAIQSHRSIVNNGMGFAQCWGMRQDDHGCTAMPFFHAGAPVLGVLAALYAGSTLHPLIGFDPHNTLQNTS